MPNRENADFEAWKIWFERHLVHMKGQPIFIGLSLGAMFLAKYLSVWSLPVSPKQVFLLAGAYDIPGQELTGTGNFLVSPEALLPASNTLPITIMHSRDDFVVPFENGEVLAGALPKADFVAFTDKNHFLIEEFPELAARIKDLNS